MKNILTFEDYKKMNIRQVESVIYRQFIDEDIKDEEIVNEGIIRKAINKAASKFIQAALADEIEKGKELEKSIKDALDGLDKGFEEIKNKINSKSNTKSKKSLEAVEKVKQAIKDVQSQAFDTLTMIGSEGEIDFGGFMGSATVVAAANFGILFTPIRSLFITRKAYKYFLGIIKQTIRRNLLIIQLNFDQFENLILQKSFETDDDSEFRTMNETLTTIINAMQMELCKDNPLKLRGRKTKEMSDYLKNFKSTQEALFKSQKENDKRNPLSSLWADQHNNTYTRTLEQIKQYINDDSQKELDALKNSITKMAGNDIDLLPFGELMISAAEEYAVHTNHGINNNFIKMSSVFNLENQKKLIELIVATQKENEAEINKRKLKKEASDLKRQAKKKIKKGEELFKKIYKPEGGDPEKYKTFDVFEKEFGEDVDCLRAYVKTDDGKTKFEELIKDGEYPIYKYFIIDDITLNKLLEHMSNLKVVKYSKAKDFYEDIVNKEQSLYYMMADRGIKDAVNGVTPAKNYGFDSIDNIAVGTRPSGQATPPYYTDTDEYDINEILTQNYFSSRLVQKGKKYYTEDKTRYFITFEGGSGEGLFDLLHKDFDTKIKSDGLFFGLFGGTFDKNISIENKETILKIIHKNINSLKIGKISTQLSEYLVRLEAHMLLKNKKDWFMPKNQKKLEKCLEVKSNDILNKRAFVEIKEEDFENIKEFLEKLKILKDNDFHEEDDSKEESK